MRNAHDIQFENLPRVFPEDIFYKMQQPGQEERAAQLADDRADEEWNDAEAWLRGIQDVARQQGQQGRINDGVYEEYWDANDDRGPRLPAHRDQFKGYGPVHLYGRDDDAFRDHPYQCGQYQQDDYRGLSLAKAIRSPWSASDRYDQRGWRRALPAHQPKINWDAASMR